MLTFICIASCRTISQNKFALQLVQHDTYKESTKGKSGILDMGNFLDTTNIDGRFDYSEWVRAYARYLDETLAVWSKITFFAVSLTIIKLLSPSRRSAFLPFLCNFPCHSIVSIVAIILGVQPTAMHSCLLLVCV